MNGSVSDKTESTTDPSGSSPRAVGAWATIKKHKVVEWTLAYVAAGFALVHAMDLASRAFEWPLVVSRLTMIAWLVGIPFAVAIAWYHGHRAQHRLSTGELAILTVLLVIAGGILWSFSRRGSESTAANSIPTASTTVAASAPAFSPPPHSIAVLPFTNLSGDPKQEYFSDGMSEELINALTQIDSLQVIARTSSFSFKGQNIDIETIGRKLNAGAILEGSIRRVGNTVRITAQLINARTGIHMWSQDYDRDLSNVLALQSEIATVVAQQLQAKLLGNEAGKIEAGGTHDPTAYDAYLRGQHILANAAQEQDYRKAMAAADEAIAADSRYADAYVLRAWALVQHAEIYAVGSYLNGTLLETDDKALRTVAASVAAANTELSQAVEASRHALMLDPSQGEAHVLIANAMMRKLDFSGAVPEFNRALSLSPGNAVVQDEYGFFQHHFGHLENSLTALRRAIELDPQNFFYRTDLAGVLVVARRPSEALAVYRDALAINPDSHWVGDNMWSAYYSEHRFELTAQFCEKAASPLDDVPRHICLAFAYHGLGKAKEAQEQLEKVKAQQGDRYAYQYARVYAQFGQNREAIDWLLKAERLREPNLAALKVDPAFDPIRDEPTFKALVERLNFPP